MILFFINELFCTYFILVTTTATKKCFFIYINGKQEKLKKNLFYNVIKQN
jgi:hypothetical protein